MQIILIQIIICYTKQLVTDITDDTISVLQIIIIHIVLENIVMCFRNHVVGFDTSARNKCDRGYNSLFSNWNEADSGASGFPWISPPAAQQPPPYIM